MRVQFWHSREDLKQFLLETEYPFEWSDGDLAECLIVAILDKSDVPIGFVWFNWTVYEKVLEIHLAVRPGYRSRWVTEGVVRDLHMVAKLAGARAVIAFTPLPRQQRMMLKIGDWKVAGPYSFTVIPNSWCQYERPKTQNYNHEGEAAASGSASSRNDDRTG